MVAIAQRCKKPLAIVIAVSDCDAHTTVITAYGPNGKSFDPLNEDAALALLQVAREGIAGSAPTVEQNHDIVVPPLPRGFDPRRN